MKVMIYNEAAYANELRKRFNKFIDDPFMQIDASKLSDNEALEAIKEFSKTESAFPFCTWVTVKRIGDSFYNGHDYKFVEFESEGEYVFSVNFSQFKFPMSPEKSTLSFSHFDSSKAQYVCMVDYQTIGNVEEYFSQRIGKKLLYIYGFPAVTALNTRKTCFFFAEDLVTPADIRMHISETQCNILQRFLDDPLLDIPPTTIVFVPDGGTPYAQRNVTCSETQQFASELFEREYRSKIEHLLSAKEATFKECGGDSCE